MKRWYSHGIELMAAALLLSYCAVGQEKPQYDMGKVQMVFLTLAPEWKPRSDDQVKQLTRAQRKYVDALIISGKCALAGPATGAGQLREIMVFKVESPEEVQTLIKSLPAIKAGMMKAEVVSWYAARNFIMSPETPLKPTGYIFGLLVRGPKWTPGETPETNRIQEGHMANINRLAEAGKLVLAGPFYDEGERRGVFIFKVETLNEAQTLTDSDPAVIAGRLRIELYKWTVPKGILK